MSRILLLRPPCILSRSSVSSPVTLPIGLAYLAASLREAGHEPLVLDALGEGIFTFGRAWSPRILRRGLDTPDIIERLPRDVDAIGVSAMFSQEWPYVEDLLAALHKARPRVPIILGGEHATALTDHILRACPSVSYVARGEGEDLVVRFAEHLDGKRRVEDVAGLSWRARDGRVVHNTPQARMRSVDHLPRPAWDLFPVDSYLAAGEGHGISRGRTMTMLATRGCPYQCTFCSSPTMWTTRYVLRSPEAVVDEMECNVRTYGAENIDFADLTTVVKREWILSFCRAIRARGLRVSWQLASGTRSEALDAEVLDEMKAAGCRSLTYAPETGSEATLTAIKKRVRLPRLFESVRLAKARGFSVKCNFIIGFPDETRGDILSTVMAALRLVLMGVDDIAIHPLSPYPGSELFDDLRRRGVIPQLDRRYFESLMAFMDAGTDCVYCRGVGPREIAFYQIAGMAACYALSYALYPGRVLRTLRNFRRRRFDSVLETRVFGLMRRWHATWTRGKTRGLPGGSSAPRPAPPRAAPAGPASARLL